ncbi:MAG: cell wall-binding repeat-containing protein, partial [Actinobacteria bacterium]|nr:cell wall-binding repeat-containing protein [Actinomycetota bacterium]
LPLIPGIAEVESASVIRIADRDRIGTAIEAAQTRDWGWAYGPDTLIWQCTGGLSVWDGGEVDPDSDFELGDTILVPIKAEDMDDLKKAKPKDRDKFLVECTVVPAPAETTGINIIVARSDDYSDALAATPLADVLDAPVLINPTDELDPRNAAEIARLAGDRDSVVVHLLGGTNALSAAVETAIDDIAGVGGTTRLQGIDRYETAVNIAWVTVQNYAIESGATLENVNPYVTTGINFPDALAAGAAAAANDGVVLLTKGEALDSRGFTEDFLVDLNDWVAHTEFWWDVNTTETFAVGGPAHRALVANDIRFVEAYDGADRYETATLAAEGTFGDPSFFAVVSGMNYPDAVVASAYIANADGPLLLSAPDALTPVTAAYLADNV